MNKDIVSSTPLDYLAVFFILPIANHKLERYNKIANIGNLYFVICSFYWLYFAVNGKKGSCYDLSVRTGSS